MCAEELSPESVQATFKECGLPSQYEIISTLIDGMGASIPEKSGHLSGDFNNDGKIDIVTLIRSKTSGKYGIAFCFIGPQLLQIAGAGKNLGNGGDDFNWMDYWEVHRGPITGKKFTGTALLVGKEESASGIIYWDKKSLHWVQEGD